MTTLAGEPLFAALGRWLAWIWRHMHAVPPGAHLHLRPGRVLLWDSRPLLHHLLRLRRPRDDRRRALLRLRRWPGGLRPGLLQLLLLVVAAERPPLLPLMMLLLVRGQPRRRLRAGVPSRRRVGRRSARLHRGLQAGTVTRQTSAPRAFGEACSRVSCRRAAMRTHGPFVITQ